MQVPDNGINWAELGHDLTLTLFGFVATIGLVVLVLGWLERSFTDR